VAPTKQLKLTNPVRATKKDRQPQIQDSDGADAQSPISEGTPDSDSTLPSQEETPLAERSLCTMLQELRATWQADFKQLSADLRKYIAELGRRTSNLENKTEEFCEAHNEVVERLQNIEDDHAA
ncbi:Hypothetical predicted protein, partial [Pelobates cultripes]